MKQSYRLTALQLYTFLAASAIMGTGVVGIAGHLAPAPARAAEAPAPRQDAPKERVAQKEARGMGRPVVHFEIGCRDSVKTSDFYAKLFDWKITPTPSAGFIRTGAGKGIDGHITALGHDPQNYVTVYVEVDDIQAYLKKATELGGKTRVPPVKIAAGQFAWFTDPDGNIVALLQPKK